LDSIILQSLNLSHFLYDGKVLSAQYSAKFENPNTFLNLLNI